ncbi:receptor-like serine/threonine-protein kinase ALE2 [Aristolochia californica]|uniref:receptor-like serine/threonine-protein kinase ALE2 n=1 Tax=Aristolochia californica TaxID=171875 RepID=UPI0035E065FD
MGRRAFLSVFFWAFVTSVVHGSRGSPSSSGLLIHSREVAPTYQAKSPIGNAPISLPIHKESVLPSPRALPPTLAADPPFVQGKRKPLPENAQSPHLTGHRQSRVMSPSSGSQESHRHVVTAPYPSQPRVLLHTPPIKHQGPSTPPMSESHPSDHHRQHNVPVAVPPKPTFTHLSPSKRSPTKGLSPIVTPTPETSTSEPHVHLSAPSSQLPHLPHRKVSHHPASAPMSSVTLHKHHPKMGAMSPVPARAYNIPPSSHSHEKAPVHSHPRMILPKKHRQRPQVPPPANEGPLSPMRSPLSPQIAPSPAPSRLRPLYSRTISPQGSDLKKPKIPIAPPVHILPPPPPNEDCAALACSEPLTNTLPGSPCGCVWPMQVGFHLSVPLYTFFPLVSELAQEIAAGAFMKQSQVRIMGANAASQQPDKTIVLIDLVPLGQMFDNTTAVLTYEKFWHKQVAIKTNFFGNYEVLYVRYPGLPPSPPVPPSNISIDDSPFSDNENGRAIKPLGVDVRKQKKGKLSGSLIAIIVLSSAIVFVLFLGVAWLLLLKHGRLSSQPSPTPRNLVAPGKVPGGGGSTVLCSGPSSASLSFSSSIAPYTGSAKAFSLVEIERATDNFNDSRILGEGGFGLVYRGILEDGIKVAVKVLKRDDQQGSREFLAEVEMLSRLHHRNLVKLIGICTEEHSRCLVYELIPNGSVESHLHDVDKEIAPLDWTARMKIALGSARGLAYLHEDSSPRVIHRDFKSSNILLEYDFTPKVSDFGLARTALDEGHEHISTRVMGTFGYVAPEYAMTGHLLVKSDVYSYGVVLLELLSGRKPVDMSQPPGQENLVTWARPLLTSKEGLETIIDPALGTDLPFDSVAKVAAIASMCVQPEVSHRPFMGEVVQALKLVCNENEEKKEGFGLSSQANLSGQNAEAIISSGSGQIPETRSFISADYESGPEAERALSASDIFSTSTRLVRHSTSESFRRHSSSGPLRTERSRPWWRSFPSGSVSEHGLALKFWRRGSDGGQRWPL